MEHQKYLNLLNERSDSKVVTRNWNTVHDQSDANYRVGNEITYSIEMWKSNLYDWNDAYILLRGDITIIGHNVTHAALRNSASLIVLQKLMKQQ